MANAANEQQVKEADKKAKFLAKVHLDDVRKVLETQSGRDYLWRIMVYAGTFECDFAGNNTQYFIEGKREMGLKIWKDVMEADPQLFVSMWKKSKSEDTNA